MVLTEDYLALRPVLSAPRPHVALQRATQAVPVAIGMAQLVDPRSGSTIQQRDRTQAGTAGKQRQDVAFSQPGERVDGLSPRRSLHDLPG